MAGSSSNQFRKYRMKIHLNKSQIIFPKPQKHFDYYTFTITKTEKSASFKYEGWYDGATLPNYMTTFPISLDPIFSEMSKAKWIVDMNNVFAIMDDYGCLSLKIQLNNEILKDLREYLKEIGFRGIG